MSDDEKLRTPLEVAERLRVETNTLAVWRMKKVGPEYVKLGRRILYRDSAVDAYIEAHTHSTVGGAS